MTTFTLTGFSVTYNQFEDAVSVGSATFEAVFPNNQAFINYSVIQTFQEGIPEVEIGGTEPLSTTINGSSINPNAEDLLGFITTNQGTHILLVFFDPATNTDYVFQIGGTPVTLPTTVAQFNALNNSITNFGTAGGAFAPGQNIPVSSFLNVDVDNTPISANPIIGTDGDDELFGTPNDDLIVTGDATAFGDYVRGSAGNDTIDSSGMNTSFAFMDLDYRHISGSISLTIDGTTNTGSVIKSAGGTDTLIGIANPMDAGNFDGGLGIRGTAANDTFNVTVGVNQWISLRGGAGADSYVLNSAGTVRIDFRDGTTGININLATGQVLNDGFGNSETISGNAARLQIFGSALNDNFVGSDGNDIYRYFGGNNVVNGGAGDDLVRYDADTVASINANLATGVVNGVLSAGGSFTDTLTSIEWLRGSNGDDVITGDDNANLIQGRSGNDTIYGGHGDDTVNGNSGNDFIGGGDGNDRLSGDEGNDTIYGGLGNDTVYGDDGNDVLYGSSGRNQLYGGNDNDLIYAGTGGDFIGGGAGNDTIRGGAAADTIYGGEGNDNIGGGAGNDLIYGAFGSNIIWGGVGNDTVQGGTGADTIYGGGSGTNQLYGNNGSDVIYAGSGGDFIGGGAGNDTIRGGDGADTIYGGTGNDNIGGGAGNDVIYASSGNNSIWGGLGDDTIHGGTGKDLLAGGDGADTFVFASAAHIGIGAGRDVITDFTAGEDRIDLSALNTTFNGTGGLVGGGQASFYHFAAGGLLIGDQNGDGTADWVLELTGAPGVTAGDFLL